MSLLMVLFGANVLLNCCAFGVSDEYEKPMDNHALEPKNMMNAPLTPMPQNEVRQFHENDSFFLPAYRLQRCPLCDSSIYPYCGEKLLHDACCCINSYDLPYHCKLADCRFLHANNCREHRLIANCCCSDDYRSVLKSLVRE